MVLQKYLKDESNGMSTKDFTRRHTIAFLYSMSARAQTILFHFKCAFC